MKSYLLYNFAICSLTKIGSYTLNISQMTVSELRVIKKMVCSNRWYLKNSEILSLDYLLVQNKKESCIMPGSESSENLDGIFNSPSGYQDYLSRNESIYHTSRWGTEGCPYI